MMKKVFLLLGALIFLLIPAMSLADTITPTTFTGSGPTGASYTVYKIVTIDTISNTFDDYGTVSIDTSEVPAEVRVLVTPGAYVGAFDRSIQRTFNFEVMFEDLAVGTHVFDIYATVDGLRVATEHDSITSVGVPVPEPTTILLFGSGLLGLVGLRRKFKN